MINEVRAARIMELPLDFIPTTRGLLARAPKSDSGPDARDATRPTKKARRPSGLPPYLASLYEVPLLDSRAGMITCSASINYLKYKATKLRESSIRPSRSRA